MIEVNNENIPQLSIIPFEIYNHPILTTGSKLLWAEYNTLSNSEKGYFKKRETTSKLMNVSVGSISKWTQLLLNYGFLEEYKVTSGYFNKQKFVRTIKFKRDKEKPIEEFDNTSVDVISKAKEIESRDDYKFDILGPI